MMYTVDEIGEDFVVVNGERLEVDPPFETLPDKQDYENWLNEVMTDVDRFFPSSRLCPMCGAIKDDQTLNDRIFVCECGHFADRDRNAAQNIERQALKMFAGVGSRRTETHVEQMLDSQEQSVMKRENMAEERQPSNPAVV